DDTTRSFVQLFLAIAMGAMLAMAAGHLRAERPLQRWIGVTFDLSVFAYAFRLWNETSGVLTHAQMLLPYVLVISSVGWFNLFVITVFGGACRLRPVQFVPLALVTVVGWTSFYFEHRNIVLYVAINVIQIALVGYTLLIIWRGWKGDLVEVRW